MHTPTGSVQLNFLHRLRAAKTLIRSVQKGMKKTILFIAIYLALSSSLSAAETNRPSVWATPITLGGIPNLYKVSDNLYRSAQPTSLGMQNLRNLEISTVVNLRAFHSDGDGIKDLSLNQEHIFMKAWHPEREDVIHFLRIVTDPKRTPVLVHCQHGADRTGTMCAMYRIVVQGWTKEEAVREMTEGGFGFHKFWDNLPEWIEKMDVESLKNDLRTR